MSKDNGGQAFPSPGRQDPMGNVLYPQSGITMRDYFAAKAMQGICAHPETWGLSVAQIAGIAYEQADAMLEARK